MYIKMPRTVRIIKPKPPNSTPFTKTILENEEGKKVMVKDRGQLYQISKRTNMTRESVNKMDVLEVLKFMPYELQMKAFRRHLQKSQIREDILNNRWGKAISARLGSIHHEITANVRFLDGFGYSPNIPIDPLQNEATFDGNASVFDPELADVSETNGENDMRGKIDNQLKLIWAPETERYSSKRDMSLFHDLEYSKMLDTGHLTGVYDNIGDSVANPFSEDARLLKAIDLRDSGGSISDSLSSASYNKEKSGAVEDLLENNRRIMDRYYERLIDFNDKLQELGFSSFNAFQNDSRVSDSYDAERGALMEANDDPMNEDMFDAETDTRGMFILSQSRGNIITWGQLDSFRDSALSYADAEEEREAEEAEEEGREPEEGRYLWGDYIRGERSDMYDNDESHPYTAFHPIRGAYTWDSRSSSRWENRIRVQIRELEGLFENISGAYENEDEVENRFNGIGEEDEFMPREFYDSENVPLKTDIFGDEE